MLEYLPTISSILFQLSNTFIIIFDMQKPLYFLILIATLSSVNCWWELGHLLVAQISEKRLKNIGETHSLDRFNELIDAFAELTDGRSNTFVEAAVWADDIKQSNVTFFNNYHFTDVVYDPQYMFVSMSEPQKDVNALNIVTSSMTVLKANKNEVTFQRAFMARYLLHLVGDIHQPLHSVSMYNSTHKKGDQGGNLIDIVTLEGKTMNLHAYMDSMAQQQKDTEPIQRPLSAEGKAFINSMSDAIMNEYPPQFFGNSEINNLSSHTWTVQSYNEAVSKIYPFVFTHKNVTKEWQESMMNLCRERVALAGYRLAATVASIYK